MKLIKLAIIPVLVTVVLSSPALAEPKQFEISIKDHRFVPAEVVVPSSEKVVLKIKNLDTTPEEFESYDLNREKVVTANGEISIYVGPLEPGEYNFFGEFNQDTAQGKLIVR